LDVILLERFERRGRGEQGWHPALVGLSVEAGVVQKKKEAPGLAPGGFLEDMGWHPRLSRI